MTGIFQNYIPSIYTSIRKASLVRGTLKLFTVYFAFHIFRVLRALTQQ